MHLLNDLAVTAAFVVVLWRCIIPSVVLSNSSWASSFNFMNCKLFELVCRGRDRYLFGVLLAALKVEKLRSCTVWYT